MPTISNTEQPSAECPICGGLGYVRENVPIGHPDFGKMFPCRCKMAELEKQRMDQLLVMSNLGHLTHMTFDSFRPDGYGLPPEQSHKLHLAFDLARQYADHPKGWLLLFGGYGCGKTHLAAAMANEQRRQGKSALFVVTPDLLDHLRATFSPMSPVRFDKRFDQVRTAPFLVMDDLGTESASPWAQEKLYQLFNHRYMAHLPTVITTTQKLEDMDPRLRTRMLDQTRCTYFVIKAPAYRTTTKKRDRRKRS